MVPTSQQVKPMPTMDLRKDLKHLYQASAKEVVEVDLPPMTFLMIDGAGDPNTCPAYAVAVEALFAVSYAVKFRVKKGPLAFDYSVMPLEGLWWADDMSRFNADDKATWKWTAMILQPPLVTRDMIDGAMEDVRRKKKLAALPLLRVESFTEGRCAQILYIGPFSKEGPTIERLHRYIDARGRRTGKHHEIYLSDIRRTDPAKWKTIVRHPLR
jgi:hypothetical protein